MRPADLWLRTLRQAEGGRLDVVCLPHAGGSAVFYRRLADSFGTAANVLAVQYPGRQDRRTEPPITSIPELAALITEVLAPLTERPLVLFGHSMGAALTFEIARTLEQRDRGRLAGVIVSGCRAPSIPRDGQLHRESDRVLIAELTKLGGTDAAFLEDPELWGMVSRAVRADYQAVETYTYTAGPDLGCPVSVLIGGSDPSVTVDQARAWRAHAPADFRFRVFDGGHFYLADPTPDLCAAIADDLRWFGQLGADRAQASSH